MVPVCRDISSKDGKNSVSHASGLGLELHEERSYSNSTAFFEIRSFQKLSGSPMTLCIFLLCIIFILHGSLFTHLQK